jgi:hypothetical protein
MKIEIPTDLKGKDLFKFLVENKSAIITEKKSVLKYTDCISYATKAIPLMGTKAMGGGEDPNICHVKVVANTSMYCDSQMDVLLRDNAAKSIKERKGMIPHLHDHIHEIGAKVGEVTSIYYQDMSMSDLGISKAGTAQALIFETDVMKAYNEQVFNQYKSGKIQQHSIGLQYVKLGLAINDDVSVAEYELWQKYADLVINQDAIQERGYFWVVPEIKLLENSAVLFGSNPITPTLDVKSTEGEPSEDTRNQPPVFDVSKALQTVKFIN